MLERLETLIAGALIASRWLMAPLYVGLIAVLLVVIVAFFHELVLTVGALPQAHADAVILAVLKLIDLVLLANLVLIMIFAGVCTLGGALTLTGRAGWTQFMGKIDFSGLKLKVVASLIAIAAVDLLESFVEISTTDKTDVLWQIAILVAFVVSAVLLASMDRLTVEPQDRGPT
jgi:uncharacterized protein (TIGR00645 family)